MMLRDTVLKEQFLECVQFFFLELGKIIKRALIVLKELPSFLV